MRSGNADLGAGLTQTRGKRVDEARHLAKHVKDNDQDISLRVFGGAFALVFGVTIFSAYGGAGHIAWPGFVALGMILVASFVWRIRKNLRMRAKHNQGVHAYRDNNQLGDHK